jgi:hypothetical protein
VPGGQTFGSCNMFDSVFWEYCIIWLRPRVMSRQGGAAVILLRYDTE